MNDQVSELLVYKKF